MSKKKVLIVEDELYTGEALATLLKRINYESVGILTSGEEAISKIDELNPDLILMDIVLDGKLDGIETSKLIKEKIDVPIIFLTAYGDLKTLKKAKLTEPDGYLVKPITDEKDLLPSIEIALHNHDIKMQLKEREEKFGLVEDIVHNILQVSKNGVINSKIEKAEIKIDYEDKSLESWFDANSNLDRLHILKFLIDESKKFTEVVELLLKAKSTVSRHLGILEENGLIIGYRKGKTTQYALVENKFIINLISSGNLTELSDTFQALGNHERLSIIQLLEESTQQYSSTEIFQVLKKPQSTIFRHLRLLNNAGLIETRKKGRQSVIILKRDFLHTIFEAYLESIKLNKL
jgi:CheY-like chemotaxis protein/DNA-binding transcriptional ArsR family regulator